MFKPAKMQEYICPHWDEKGDKYDHECSIAPVHIPCSGNPEGDYKQCKIYLDYINTDWEKVRKDNEERIKSMQEFREFLKKYNKSR